MSAIRYVRDAAVFAPCYIALDWASYIDPVGPFNITPWNPQPALAIAWMLLSGLSHAPAVFVTIVAADVLVRGERSRLHEQLVDERRLAVIDVRDDRDVAEVGAMLRHWRRARINIRL